MVFIHRRCLVAINTAAEHNLYYMLRVDCKHVFDDGVHMTYLTNDYQVVCNSAHLFSLQYALPELLYTTDAAS